MYGKNLWSLLLSSAGLLIGLAAITKYELLGELLHFSPVYLLGFMMMCVIIVTATNILMNRNRRAIIIIVFFAVIIAASFGVISLEMCSGGPLDVPLNNPFLAGVPDMRWFAGFVLMIFSFGPRVSSLTQYDTEVDDFLGL